MSIPCVEDYCEGEYQPKGTGFECTDCEDWKQMHDMVEIIFNEVFPNRAKDKAFMRFSAKQKGQEAQPPKPQRGITSGIVEA